MRDFAHIMILIALVISLWKRPWIGALGFVWFSFMNSHRLTYGFAYDFPFALILAVCTLMSLATTNNRRWLPPSPMLKVWLAFLFWMCVTAIFAITDKNDVWDQFVRTAKIQIMGFVLFVLVYTKQTIIASVAVMSLSLAFYGIKGGAFTLLTGGSYKVWGPPGSNIEGNNELALALVMMLPMLYFLSKQVTKIWHRNVLYLFIVLCVFSILGSHSRGAFLAIIAIAVAQGMKSKHPVAVLVGLGVVLLLAMAFMPDNWSSRMNTIGTYEQDMSANQRLTTWTMILNLVADRPLVGAGFRLDNPSLYIRYLGEVRYGVTQAGPHSLYFQALGESGIPGLILFLCLGYTAWRYGTQLVKMFEALPEHEWAVDLARMIQVSIIGFASGGAFLGLMHWDAPYYLLGVYFMLHNYHRELHKAEATATRAPFRTMTRNRSPKRKIIPTSE